MTASRVVDEVTHANAVAQQDTTAESVKERAYLLAAKHSALGTTVATPTLTEMLPAYERALAQAHADLATGEARLTTLSRAAEWLLDNYYIVQQATRQIRQDMPRGYYRQLPKLAEPPLAGYPRIYAIARDIFEIDKMRVHLDHAREYLAAYQEFTALTMGEIWALPTMLRLCCVGTLANVFLESDLTAAPVVAPLPGAALPGETIDTIAGNCILTLRAVAEEDWNAFFEETSLLDQALRRDPAGVYPLMDFATRNRYRQVVEKLAKATEHDELPVAEQALQLAAQSSTSNGAHSHQPGPPQRHVGYYLCGGGRDQLEAVLHLRLHWWARLRRALAAHAVAAYFVALGVLSLLFLAMPVAYARGAGGSPWQIASTLLLALIPATTVAISLFHWGVTQVVPPRLLPKLDFRKGIAPGYETMVVIPALLTGPREVKSLLRQLELHYLRNSDKSLHFALLTDFGDADAQSLPEDDALLAQAEAGIQFLNTHYGRTHQDAASVARRNGTPQGPFHFFHRKRLWNETERVWMGWERKRGKLDEFSCLLHDLGPTTFIRADGNLAASRRIRYVITLDADTILPPGGAARLAGALAHPLNQAVFDPRSGKVNAGYTVLQPRTEIALSSSNRSRFSQIYAGDKGLDLYTLAVSDVYQDLFGEGSYVGKGIFDVAAFHRSIVGRVPQNLVLSHDLLEGSFGRAGLVSDIVLYEDYPANYLVYTQRMHRWIRGDWQLLPWLIPAIHARVGSEQRATLGPIDRWKLADNLRRSLLPIVLFLLLVVGWLWLPGSAVVWTLVVLVTLGMPVLTGLLGWMKRSVQTGDLMSPDLKEPVLRWLLALVFLPYETIVTMDAIFSTLVRLGVTRSRMLQWTTAAHSSRLMGRQWSLWLAWRKMRSAPLLALIVALLIVILHPNNLLVALPLLLAWMVSPLVAWWISRPIGSRRPVLTPADHAKLRRLARRTWFYFERFVGPDDNWLPPDHFQEAPRGVVAHRTSPTNIGLGLLSTLGAYDLGYIGVRSLVLHVNDALDAIDNLELYRGHLLNWYDTQSLRPLAPRYVSTVDSGNLAACLIALRQGCLEILNDLVPRPQRWEGLIDTIDVLAEVVEPLAALDPVNGEALRRQLAIVRQNAAAEFNEPMNPVWLLIRLYEQDLPNISDRVETLIDAHSRDLDTATLQEISIWLERLDHHLVAMRREAEHVEASRVLFAAAPDWLHRASSDSEVGKAWHALMEDAFASSSLHALPQQCQQLRARLTSLDAVLSLDSEVTTEQREAAEVWCTELAAAFDDWDTLATDLIVGINRICDRCAAHVAGMRFDFLFDPRREVFHIGYNVDTSRLDDNYYDLFASEARIASFVAIAKEEAPTSHWMHMARPRAAAEGSSTLLSWNGSMFEYLMPNLLLRQYTNSLLEQSIVSAVDCQIAYGRKNDVPWGISESGYYRFDTNFNYQYRGFGVPGLGLKRGLDEDLVVTPYASLLALPIAPQAVLENIDRLVARQMLGAYGFYEAMDFTRMRRPAGLPYGRVQSYMSHHQAMIFLSLVNYVAGHSDGPMVRRFHRDPRVQSIELLLQEQVPERAPQEELSPVATTAAYARPHTAADSWPAPVDTAFPEAHYLSNGRYGVLITNAGGGFSNCVVSQYDDQNLNLTRWRADTTLDDWGAWIYLQDKDTGATWRACRPNPADPNDNYRVFFAPHKAEFYSQRHEIAAHVEVTVAATEDVEIRLVRLTNQSNRRRRLRLTSYAEVALSPQPADRRHPAFAKLFVEGEYLPAVNGLVFHRRPRAAGDLTLYLLHSLVAPAGVKVTGAYEMARERFLGRWGTPDAPACLAPGGAWLSGATSSDLDPIMALGQELVLGPYEVCEVTLITAAANSRQKAIALGQSYGRWATISQAQEAALAASETEMRELALTSPELASYQQLLSLLFYPHAARRAAPETLASNRGGQAMLWPFGISGDYPILLVRVQSAEDAAIVEELLRAHAWWRRRNLKIDLVILNDEDGSYAQELQGHMLQLIVRTQSENWLNTRGGVFLLRGANLGDGPVAIEARTLLFSAARIVLDGAGGTLARQLEGLHQLPVRLPQFVPAPLLEGETPMEPALRRPADLQFDNGLGGFSADGREYVIYLAAGERTQQSSLSTTPAPWINVIANPDFGFLVSEGGGGYTWAGNSGENRLTPWRNDPVGDRPGEAIYLRDEETADIWSPLPLPAGARTPYLIRHGAGYTVFEHGGHGLKQQVEYFVAPDAPVKFIRLRVENTEPRPRRITVTYYAEWVLGTDRDVTQQYVVTEYDAEYGALLAQNPYHDEFGQQVAFLAASRRPHGVTADRTEFLGRLQTYDKPAALQRIGLSGAVGPGLDPCAALQVHLDIGPNAVEEVHFILGQGSDRAASLQLVAQYQEPGRADSVWKEAGAYWDTLLGAVQVKTPDAGMNLLLNRWLLYQTLSCRIWGRSALYQSSGAFGFRDQLQDVLALVHAAPEVTRAHIMRAAQQQFPEGDVLHWWHEAPQPDGSALRSRGVRTRISDNLLWLPYVAARYVQTTGDRALLAETASYLRGEPLKPEEHEHYAVYSASEYAESLYLHCQRAIAHGSRMGAHGLPLMGAGDWNDGMNRVGIGGRGESVWLAWFRAATLRAMANLAKAEGDDALAEQYREQVETLGAAIENNAWDGGWYLRAYYDDGHPLGSVNNIECRIDSIAQSWAVLSGIGDRTRATQALDEVYMRLVDARGQLLLLFTPPFDKTRRDPGYIKGYPPGIRENGGQYTHAALWTVWAFAELGDSERTWALFRLLNPIYHADSADKAAHYKVEPYIVAADIAGRDPLVGRGGWTWYTGSAGWMYRLGVEAILGLQREGNNLHVKPCIPASWDGFEMEYRYQRSTYAIRVHNSPERSQDGATITLDGASISGGAIPLVDDGRRHEVEVQL